MSLGSILGKLALLRADAQCLGLAWQGLEIAGRAMDAADGARRALREAERRGAEHVARAAKAERALAELQVQADGLSGELAQARADLRLAQDEAREMDRLRHEAHGAQQAAERERDAAREENRRLRPLDRENRSLWRKLRACRDYVAGAGPRPETLAKLDAILASDPYGADPDPRAAGPGGADLLGDVGVLVDTAPAPPPAAPADRCPDIRTSIQRAAALLDKALPLAEGADSGDVLLWIRAARRYAQAPQHRADALTAVRQAIQRLRDERRYYAPEGQGVLSRLAETLGEAEKLLSIEPGSAASKGAQP